MLTFVPTQPFVKFKGAQYAQAGIIWGPQPYKKHIIVTIANTEQNAGFIVSHDNMTGSAGFVAPGSYMNPNINIEEKKITYLPTRHEEAQKLAYYITLAALKPLLQNYSKFGVVNFETNNFHKYNLHTRKLELSNHKYKSQKIRERSFEEYFQKKASELSNYNTPTHLKKKFEISNVDNTWDNISKQIKILSLEQRIKYVLNNYYSI